MAVEERQVLILIRPKRVKNTVLLMRNFAIPYLFRKGKRTARGADVSHAKSHSHLHDLLPSSFIFPCRGQTPNVSHSGYFSASCLVTNSTG
jgi:hypothetical protein